MQTSSFDLKKNIPKGLIAFAKIVGVFGIRGEAKIFLYNRETELLGQWIRVQVFDGKKITGELELKLRGAKKIIGSIKGITKPEELDALMNLDLLLKEEDLPQLEEDEFYHHQLLGIEARTEDGQVLGTVQEVTQSTVTIFTISDGSQEYYIPFISERVLSVLPNEYIIVKP